MAEQVLTVSDFVKLVVTDTASEIWLSCCPIRQEEESWEEFLTSPFTRKSVIDFAGLMADEIAFEAFQWSTEESRGRTFKNGHNFLRIVHEKAVELGLDVELEEIDQDLTFSEEMVDIV